MPELQGPLSYFAPSCPQCGGSNQPNPVTIGAGLSGLLLLCAAILLAVQVVRHPPPLQPPSEQPGKSGSAAPNEETADGYSWIVQAMAEWDAQAKQNVGTLQI